MVGKRVKSWPDTIIIYHYIDRKYFNKSVFLRHLWSCFVFVTCWRGNWWKYEHHCVEWTSRHTKHEAKKVEALSHKQQKSPHSVEPHATIISTCTQSNHGVVRPPGTRPSTPRWSCMMWTSLHQCSLVADLVIKPKVPNFETLGRYGRDTTSATANDYNMALRAYLSLSHVYIVTC